MGDGKESVALAQVQGFVGIIGPKFADKMDIIYRITANTMWQEAQWQHDAKKAAETTKCTTTDAFPGNYQHILSAYKYKSDNKFYTLLETTFYDELTSMNQEQLSLRFIFQKFLLKKSNLLIYVADALINWDLAFIEQLFQSRLQN